MTFLNNNAQGLNMVIAILVLLVGFFMITAIGAEIINTVPDALESQICEFNIRAAHQALDSTEDTIAGRAGKFFTDEAAKGSIESPLCTTKIVDIDLTDAKSEEELALRVSNSIGRMTNVCWSQFGSGEVYDTFNVGYDTDLPVISWALNLKKNIWQNHYFSCYQFRFLFPKDLIKAEIKTSDLINFDTGTLWRYAASNGEALDDSITTQEYLDIYRKNIGTPEAKKYLPYAGAITWNNLGYLEFVESTDLTWKWESGIPDTLYPIDIYQGIRPGSGPALDVIRDGAFYEVRYYSPIVGDSMISSEEGIQYFVNSLIKNNIKVMPVGAESAGTEIIGIVT
jgi:hypothetical protein